MVENSLYTEFEIELPGARLWRKLALAVRECQSNLYDFEQVHIASHSLIVVVRRRFETSYRSGDYTWKFSVLKGRFQRVRDWRFPDFRSRVSN